MIVRQSDAHAWAEAMVDGQWQRFDPTAAVAPSRIERGLGAALPDGRAGSVPRPPGNDVAQEPAPALGRDQLPVAARRRRLQHRTAARFPARVRARRSAIRCSWCSIISGVALVWGLAVLGFRASAPHGSADAEVALWSTRVPPTRARRTRAAAGRRTARLRRACRGALAAMGRAVAHHRRELRAVALRPARRAARSRSRQVASERRCAAGARTLGIAKRSLDATSRRHGDRGHRRHECRSATAARRATGRAGAAARAASPALRTGSGARVRA